MPGDGERGEVHRRPLGDGIENGAARAHHGRDRLGIQSAPHFDQAVLLDAEGEGEGAPAGEEVLYHRHVRAPHGVEQDDGGPPPALELEGERRQLVVAIHRLAHPQDILEVGAFERRQIGTQ